MSAPALQRISPLLQVADLGRSIAFYVGKLGFEEKWADGEGFAIVSRDGCDLFLGQKQREVDLRNVTARLKPDGYTAYDLHFFCTLGSVDGLWKEWKRAGVPMPEEFTDGPQDRDYGVRDFSITDPDGYEIVFGAPIE